MMTVNTDNFDVNNWGEFVHKKALNDVIQQINQVDAEQNNAISKISDLANQANQNAVNALKIANVAMESATNADNTATQAENTANALKNDVDSLTQKVNDLENSKVTKTDAQKQSFGIKFTGTDTASNKYSGNIAGASYPLNVNNDVFSFLSGRFDFDSITFDATALHSPITLTLESELPNFDLHDDLRMNGMAQITDGTNEITTDMAIVFTSATELSLRFTDYVDLVIEKLEWLKTGTKHMYVTFNDID